MASSCITFSRNTWVLLRRSLGYSCFAFKVLTRQGSDGNSLVFLGRYASVTNPTNFTDECRAWNSTCNWTWWSVCTCGLHDRQSRHNHSVLAIYEAAMSVVTLEALTNELFQHLELHNVRLLRLISKKNMRGC